MPPPGMAGAASFFRGFDQARDRSRVLQRRAHDLGRVDDAVGHALMVEG